MKQLIIILSGLLISLTGYAQVNLYQTTFLSTAEWDKQGKVYIWSEWEKTEDIPVIMDTEKRRVTICSNLHQEYTLYGLIQKGNDGGGDFEDHTAVDQAGFECIVKTRIQDEGKVLQICIYYNDTAWAYCLERKP